MDICLALVGGLALSPVLVACAIAVRLSSEGPTLYAWEVVGRGGVPFRGYKFRSMIPNADAMKPELSHLNEMSGPVFKLERDPRVTPVGRFLRRWSLDELPQLWSVLVGDMSLVGPRPAGISEWPGYALWQRRRLSVTPGITCLWQARGRNSVRRFDDWVSMDLDYIDNWSLSLDMRLVLETIVTVLRGTGR